MLSVTFIIAFNEYCSVNVYSIILVLDVSFVYEQYSK